MADTDNELILPSIKAALGLGADYTPFDLELKFHIASVISELKQLGVDPVEDFVFDNDTPWIDLLGEEPTIDLDLVKGFMFLKVKIIFDGTSMAAHHLTSYNRMLEEYVWRITHAANPAADNMLPALVEEL